MYISGYIMVINNNKSLAWNKNIYIYNIGMEDCRQNSFLLYYYQIWLTKPSINNPFTSY